LYLRKSNIPVPQKLGSLKTGGNNTRINPRTYCGCAIFHTIDSTVYFLLKTLFLFEKSAAVENSYVYKLIPINTKIQFKKKN
jgi:hypothetical protein